MHCDASPGTLKTDCVFTIRNSHGIADLTCHTTNQLLRQIHHVIIISICLIQLHTSKLRIMPGTNPLIPKNSSQFIHTRKSSNNKSLQMQFRRNAKSQFHIHTIVIRFKRFCLSSTRLSVQHGCFNFQKALVIQLTAQTGRNFGTFVECLSHGRIDNQIQMTITVSLGNIRKSMVLIRKRQGRLGQHGPFLGIQCQFSLIRPANRSLGTDNIS
mmetsp:Transcript_15609/g.26332  ORF Transcript_15609/g.26332 Transcript_15609/m.26332 type:complete len:213 (+) Transcript_15609:613-1251(+)